MAWSKCLKWFTGVDAKGYCLNALIMIMKESQWNDCGWQPTPNNCQMILKLLAKMLVNPLGIDYFKQWEYYGFVVMTILCTKT